jgi:hypothetical protein
MVFLDINEEMDHGRPRFPQQPIGKDAEPILDVARGGPAAPGSRATSPCGKI